MKEKILLKDQLFNKGKVEYLSKNIKSIYKEFDIYNFEKEVLSKFPDLELKERIKHISNMLEKYLPSDFETAVDIILQTLPELPDLNKTDNDFGDFIFAPYGEYIASNGATKNYLELSLNALEKLTSRFSMEDAIRTFINSFEQTTFEKVLSWAKSSNYHIRRLASEGTRPKLPWAKKINLDYKKSKKILDNLHNDNTRYVTRSVANHLNDVSKIDSGFVIETLKDWQSKTNNKKEFDFIKKHSLRTLVKKGDKKTLEFLGFDNNHSYEINKFIIKNNILNIGETLEFEFEIKNKEDKKADFIIDYKLYFIGKNKKLYAKVYKINKINLEKLSSKIIIKKHPLKIMTTKKLYSGEHFLELQINGNISEKISFFLN